MYDGVWSLEGFNWVYEAEGSLTLTVRSDTTLEQMREILYKELEVDSLVYDLKLELCSLYMKGHRCLPEVIKKDSQLRTLLMRAIMSNTKLTSIFVTRQTNNNKQIFYSSNHNKQTRICPKIQYITKKISCRYISTG